MLEGAPEALGGVLGEARDEVHVYVRESGLVHQLHGGADTGGGVAAADGSEDFVLGTGWYNIYIMEELHTILSLGAGGSTKLVDPTRNRIERVGGFAAAGGAAEEDNAGIFEVIHDFAGGGFNFLVVGQLGQDEVAIFEGIHALNDIITGKNRSAMKVYISARSNVLDAADELAKEGVGGHIFFVQGLEFGVGLRQMADLGRSPGTAGLFCLRRVQQPCQSVLRQLRQGLVPVRRVKRSFHYESCFDREARILKGPRRRQNRPAVPGERPIPGGRRTAGHGGDPAVSMRPFAYPAFEHLHLSNDYERFEEVRHLAEAQLAMEGIQLFHHRPQLRASGETGAVGGVGQLSGFLGLQDKGSYTKRAVRVGRYHE